MKKLLLVMTILIAATAAVLAGFYSYVSITASNYLYNDPAAVPKKRLGVLLGTTYYTRDGKGNLFFIYRIRAAATLYKSGRVKKILASGARRSRYYDETRDMERELIKAGVPSRDIIIDNKGYRTYLSIARVKSVFHSEDIVVISQKFHNERALYLARNMGIEAVGYNAPTPKIPYSLPTRIRELFARIRAFLDLNIAQTGTDE